MKRLMEEEPASNGDIIVVLADATADDCTATSKTQNVDDSDDDDQSEKTMGDDGGSDNTSNGDYGHTTTMQPTTERIDQPENDVGATVTATVVEPLTTGHRDTNREHENCVVSSIVMEEDDVTAVEEKNEISTLPFQELESTSLETDNYSPPSNELREGTSLPNAVDELKENELSRATDICEQLTKHATLTDVNSAQQQMDQK